MADTDFVLNKIRQSLVSEEAGLYRLCSEIGDGNFMRLEPITLYVFATISIDFIFNTNVRYTLCDVKADSEWLFTGNEKFTYISTTDERFQRLVWPTLTDHQKIFVVKNLDIFSRV